MREHDFPLKGQADPKHSSKMPLMTELLDQHTVGVKDFGFSFNLSTSFRVTLQ